MGFIRGTPFHFRIPGAPRRTPKTHRAVFSCAGLLGLCVFFLFPPPAAAQNSLENELRNLARQITGSSGRGEALARTAYLKELSGDIEGAAGAWEMAAQADPGSRDCLLRGAACFIALGEWERADAAVKRVLAGGADQETRAHARFLAAQLEGLRSGGTNTSGLAALLADETLGAYKPRIYFTLWKLTGRENWRRALTEEFPRSPEAAAAGGGSGKFPVSAASTAMWLLFPGRQAAAGMEISPPQNGGTREAPSLPALPAGSTAPAAQQASGTLLQAGLFSREENARTLVERLEQAGFDALAREQVRSGAAYVAVYVTPGPDVNRSIRELKAAGFDSFPVSAAP
ncbi:MAG: SPOR domain-containing protein [Treponema sp.]|jgi:hypothetical protein|nr:SPOR domain-containing protein [Treponema sp.]